MALNMRSVPKNKCVCIAAAISLIEDRIWLKPLGTTDGWEEMARRRRLMFGTAGLPSCAKGMGAAAGIDALADLGLDAMEIEFVRGVWMSPETAVQVKRRARARGIYLTAHAPYWLNLNSPDRAVVKATTERIMASAEMADLAGARHLAFHAAFYCGDSPKRAFGKVKRRLARLASNVASKGLKISLSPELMGRPSQFGSLEEILSLCSEIDGVTPCLDLSHNHARTGGYNTYEEYRGLLDKVRGVLGAAAMRRMHLHVAGIDYGPKGERKHLNLRESDLDYRALLAALKHRGAGGILICESPNIEKDALLLRRTYYRLG
jgi:deoxyribonuclease-4